jgi:ketosteroid isomerase-like protein
MSTGDTNVEVVRRLYAAFAAGDAETVRSCFADDAVWHLPGRSPVAGVYRGVDAIFDDFFAVIRAESGGTLQVDLVDVFDGGESVVALQHVTGERPGKRLDILACQLITLRDGKIAEVRGFRPTSTRSTSSGPRRSEARLRGGGAWRGGWAAGRSGPRARPCRRGRRGCSRAGTRPGT